MVQLKSQLVLCTGIREEYGEEVYSLIHCYNRVFNTASGTWEVDATESMRLELLSECDIGQEWINTWKEVNKVNDDGAFIDLYVEPNEDFWEECDFNGSAYNEELITSYREQLTRLIQATCHETH